MARRVALAGPPFVDTGKGQPNTEVLYPRSPPDAIFVSVPGHGFQFWRCLDGQRENMLREVLYA
eukprot:8822326-Pyramimonas_sp.AAC.1